MKKVPISILCGAAVILVTIIMYFVILENIFAQIICFITLVGVLLSEVVVTLLAYFSKGEPRKVGAVVAASFMIPISIILSIVYIVNFPNGYGSYAGWYFSLLVVTLLIAAIVWKFSNNRVDDDAQLQNAKSNMIELRKLVKCILIKNCAFKYKKELEKIEDKLHYSNDSVITPLDESIRNKLLNLANNIENEDYDAQYAINEISEQIDSRNIFSKKTV